MCVYIYIYINAEGVGFGLLDHLRATRRVTFTKHGVIYYVWFDKVSPKGGI